MERDKLPDPALHTFSGLSLASEAAAGMNLPNARDGKARSVVRLFFSDPLSASVG